MKPIIKVESIVRIKTDHCAVIPSSTSQLGTMVFNDKLKIGKSYRIKVEIDEIESQDTMVTSAPFFDTPSPPSSNQSKGSVK